MSELEKIVFKMNFLNDIINASTRFKDSETITPEILRGILIETKMNLENNLGIELSKIKNK